VVELFHVPLTRVHGMTNCNSSGFIPFLLIAFSNRNSYFLLNLKAYLSFIFFVISKTRLILMNLEKLIIDGHLFLKSNSFLKPNAFLKPNSFLNSNSITYQGGSP
jgi:hypothetical protein